MAPQRDAKGRFVAKAARPEPSIAQRQAVRLEIRGLKELDRKLKWLARNSKENDDWDVEVGYTKFYAVYVHENLTAWHAEGTQAKYLEEPLRLYRPLIMAIVIAAYKRLKKLKPSLLMGGLKLQSLSQKVVPVDTGDLRGSAYTKAIKK